MRPRRLPFLALLLAPLAALPASPGLAAMSAGLNANVSHRSSYLRIDSDDTTIGRVEDLETADGLGFDLLVDTTYFHTGLLYSFSAVEFSDQRDLGYVDQQLSMVVDGQRLVSRFTRSGHLQVILNARTGRSLPALSPGQVRPTRGALQTEIDAQQAGDPAAGDAIYNYRVANLLASEYLLDLGDADAGWLYIYGLNYGDEIGVSDRYEVGWQVNDARYNSDVLPDQAWLNVYAAYVRDMREWETGVTLVHNRYVRGVVGGNELWSLQTHIGKTAYRLAWRLGGGTTYYLDDYIGRFGGNAQVRLDYRLRRVEWNSTFNSDFGFQTVGQLAPRRIDSVTLVLKNTQRWKWPRSISFDWQHSDLETSTRLVAIQEFIRRPSFRAALSFSRDRLHWRDVAGADLIRRDANVVTVRLTWYYL